MADGSIFETDNSGSAGTGSDGTGSSGTSSTTTTNTLSATQSYNVAQVIEILKNRIATGQTTELMSKDDKDRISAILAGKNDPGVNSSTASTILKYGAIAVLIFFIFKPQKNG